MQGMVLDDVNNLVINPKRDANGMIVIGAVIGNIDYQRARLIIEMHKGEIRQFPFLGFGASNWVNGQVDNAKFKNELLKQLKLDGIDAAVIADGASFKLDIK
jgi:hypothetical protein